MESWLNPTSVCNGKLTALNTPQARAGAMLAAGAQAGRSQRARPRPVKDR